MTSPTPCPESDRLKELLGETLSADEQTRLEEHLEVCDRCQATLEAFVADGQSWATVARRLRQKQPEPEAALQQVMQEIQDEVKSVETEGDATSREPMSLDFLQPDDDPESLGRLGPYRIERVIARGGMGVVLKGYDAELNRYVAIKVLAPQLASNATARSRFRREARAAAAVAHEHVVAIHAVDEAAELPYLVMEFVSGRSLEDRIKHSGPLEPKEILRIGMQTAAGLAAAHTQGLVHRDIKPGNILLEDGVERVKITDFGLARAVDDVHFTKPGVVAGTPEYMSPEQAQGKPVDRRTDLFSLGGVLYAMCTGRTPFHAQGTLAMIRCVCEEEPRPIRESNPEIPDWLVRVIGKLMAKEAGDRFQSATDVEDLLGEYLAYMQDPAAIAEPKSPEIPVQGIRKRRSKTGRRRVWGIAAATILLLAGTFGFTETVGLTDVTSTVIRIVRGDGTLIVEVDDPNVRVTVDGGELIITGTGPKEIRLRPGRHELHATKDGKPIQTTSLTISRGGRQVVKVSRLPAVTSKPKTTTRCIWTGPGVEFTGQLSPGGRFLTFVDWNTGNLAVRDLLDGKSRNLTDEGTWDEPNQYAEGSVWSSDSRQVAYMWENEGTWELRIVGLDDESEPRIIYRAEGLSFVYPLAWSPDGRHILSQLMHKDRTHQLAMISVADGESQILKSLGRRAPSLASFSPDGRSILYDLPPEANPQPRDIFLLAVDGTHETALVAHPANDRCAMFSPDGKWVVFPSDRSGADGVWAVPVAEGSPTGPAQSVISGIGRIHPLGFAQDGTYCYGVGGAKSNVYSAELDPEAGRIRGEPTMIVRQFEGFNRAADWSPDGQQLAYWSRRISPDTPARRQALLIRDLATGEERLLWPELARFIRSPSAMPRWLPDGKSMVIQAADLEGQRGFFRLDVHGGDVTLLWKVGFAGTPAWSADGKRAFYFRSEDCYLWRIVSRDLETGREDELYRQRAQGPKCVALSPDGRRLACTLGRALHVMPATGGESRVLWETPASVFTPFTSGLVWTPDGERLLLGKKKDAESDVSELWQVPLDGGEPQRLGLEMDGLSHLRISPDGKRISFTGRESGQNSEVWAMENPRFSPPDET